jgi:hypothetical protein
MYLFVELEHAAATESYWAEHADEEHERIRHEHRLLGMQQELSDLTLAINAATNGIKEDEPERPKLRPSLNIKTPESEAGTNAYGPQGGDLP